VSPRAVVVPERVTACLFDMDGVLTRTAELHAAAWKQLFDGFLSTRAPAGVDRSPFTQDDYERYVDGRLRADGTRSFLATRGITLPEGAPDDAARVESVYGLGARKDACFHELLHARGVARYETSVTFVEDVRARGLGCGVVSASRNCRDVLQAAGILDLFDAVVDGVLSGDLGLRGKPAPDTFLEATRRLDVAPDGAAVFEDAAVGVAAGRTGGFGWVVGVDRGGRRSALRAAGADAVVEDLSQLEWRG
jgi:beta-phosphoglucomutase family hydrolase